MNTAYTAGDTIFWPWLTIGAVTRPLNTTPKKYKDEHYDDRCGRYYLGNILQQYRDYYIREYAANRQLVLNGPSSWGSTEAIRELLGSADNPTGRLALKYAIMQPMHTRLVGVGSGISAAAKAQATTSNVYVRKENAMYQTLLRTIAAQEGPELAGAMAPMGISPDEEKNLSMHENLWTDPYAKTMTDLVTAMGKRQKLEEKLAKIASNVALSGVAAVHVFPNGNYMEAEVCDPGEVGWDTSAIKQDFSDGEFCYHARLMSVQQIAEQFQPAKDKIEAIDRWSAQQSAQLNNAQNVGWPQRRPRVFTVYYRDMDFVEFGYVLKDGEPHYCAINRSEPGETEIEYTDKDLIDPPDDEFVETWSNQERRMKKQVRQIQTLRYVTMIPWEYLPGAFNRVNGPDPEPFHTAKNRIITKIGGEEIIQSLAPTGDLILDSGEYPLQERDPDNVFGVSFPIKFSSWMNMSGMVIAPLSCIRDIQTVMNATLSDMMFRMSRAEVPTTVFDDAALNAAGVTSAEAARNLKDGKAFGIRGMLVGGVQNAVTNVGTALDPRFYQMFTILDQLYMMAQNSTGVYDQNFGAPAGQDALVRVKELQSRQSGIMLKPFVDAVGSVVQQVYQFDAQAGKYFFRSRPWALKQMVGDKGAEMLILSEDFTDEQFRVEVVLTADAEQRREMANQMALQDLQMGLLDPQEAASLRGRSMPEDIYEGERRFTRRMAEAARQQAEQQQQMMEQQAIAQQQQAIEMEEAELSKEATNAALKQEQMQRKSAQPFMQALSEHVKPQEDEALALEQM